MMWKKLHANDRFEMVDALDNLAEALRVQRKLAEAEAQQREAVAMSRRLFGNDSADVADSIPAWL